MPILLYLPAYCGLESFCRHPLTSGALPSNRIVLGDWQAVNLFNLANFPHPKLCTTYSTGCYPVLIGLRNTTALSRHPIPTGDVLPQYKSAKFI